MSKAKKVRETLVQMDGVIDVFVNKEIFLQFTKPEKFDADAMAKLLAKEKVVVSKVEPTKKSFL